MINPYEIYNDCVAVQARVLFSSNKIVKAHEDSLNLCSYDSLNYKIQNGVIKKLRNNGPNTPTLVAWDSLPNQWQHLLIKAFGEPNKKIVSGLFEKEFVQDTEALEFYLQYSPSPGKHLTSSQIEEYTLNASVLNLVDRIYQKRTDYRASLKGSTSRTEIRKTIANDTARFKAVKPHTLPEHVDNLFRDLREYKKQKYAYLISGKVGNSNARVVTNDVEQLLNSLFAGQNHKPSYEDTFRLYTSFLSGYIEVINNETGECYNPKDFPTIKRSTILNYLSKWRNEIGNEAVRSGDRQKLRGKFTPSHSLTRPTFAGSIISIDDRQPPFEYEKGKRMWFYLGADIASGAIVTWVWGKDKEGIILDFYRQMVRLHHHYGVNLPHELEAESNLNSGFQKTFLAEGAMFQQVRIEANNARGKWIEQGVNRKIRYKNEKDQLGWIARPFARDESNQEGSHDVPLIKYPELVKARLADIEDWNNEPHHDKPEMSRFDYWLNTQHPNLKPTNYRAILPHIGWLTKTSVNTGFIRLNNEQFVLGLNNEIALGETLISLLDIVESEDVQVYWLDTLEGGVLKALVFMGNDYICEALHKPKYNKARLEQTDADKAQRELMSAYQSTVDAYQRKQVKSIDKVIVIDNTPKPERKFVMPGLSRFEVSDKPAVILPELPEEDFETVSMPVKRNLRDRF